MPFILFPRSTTRKKKNKKKKNKKKKKKIMLLSLMFFHDYHSTIEQCCTKRACYWNGDVAQMVEHFLSMEGAVGSMPTISTFY